MGLQRLPITESGGLVCLTRIVGWSASGVGTRCQSAAHQPYQQISSSTLGDYTHTHYIAMDRLLLHVSERQGWMPSRHTGIHPHLDSMIHMLQTGLEKHFKPFEEVL